MNYELALRLKGAGFPQTHGKENDYGVLPTFPTLSELIGAMPRDFTLEVGHEDEPEERLSYAFIGLEYSKAEFRGRGTSPEEAVALLWLELRK